MNEFDHVTIDWDKFDCGDVQTITIDSTFMGAPIGQGSITTDVMEHTPLVITTLDGEEIDVAMTLESMKKKLDVMEDFIDTLLEEACKDTTVREALEKHDFIRKLSK